MAKKQSVSSRPEKPTNASAGSTLSKPLSEKHRTLLARIAKRQAKNDDSGIDYSDIPELTDEQLAEFKRAPKILVAARIDRDVYNWLRKDGGVGYSTKINGILRAVMERAAGPRT
jgi:uncharacterized protein (DUF4415 family)